MNKKTDPIISENIKADLSITNEKVSPKSKSLPDMSFLNRMKLIISESRRLKIIKYDTGFVSLFIVLLKLNKSIAIKKDEIIGSPGISQESFNNIAIKRDYFYMQ